jgi:hypothetical protein
VYDTSATISETFINPAKKINIGPSTTHWYDNGIFFTADYTNPIDYIGGTLGSIMYYPGLDGDAKESQILTYDFMHVMDIYNS